MAKAERTPKAALITGASSGIGLAFARECAGRGMTVVCVSNDAPALDAATQAMRGEFPVAIHALCIDLTLPDAPEQCLAFCDEHGLGIDLLINNAGIFFFEPLLDVPNAKILAMIDLHITCVTRLCILFGQRMRERQFGYILNMSSMSAWMSMPGINLYNATKNYIRSLSRSLFYELHPYNVGVTVVCPGGIDTDLFRITPNIRNLGRKLSVLMSPQKLVKKALRATFKRRMQTIPGIMNHFFIGFIQLLPNWVIHRLIRHHAALEKFRKPHHHE
ncbi:MAG: SDR family NAD(P)-dependent oxidoreductase [Proteobacteria bacterium]|nr:SDR family NAD(P)-dependent oxidoreductase [Pseudomonadota bacterium]